jgi:hypothetical protein
MQRSTHSIGKVSFHLKGVKTEKVFAQRQQVASYLQGNFVNMLEELLNEIVTNDELLHIPQLKIDVKEPIEDLNTYKLNALIKQELRKQLNISVQEQQGANEETSAQNKTDHNGFRGNKQNSFLFWQQAWTHYLQHGFLPGHVSHLLWEDRLLYFRQFRKTDPGMLKSFFIDVLKDKVQLRRFLANESASVQLFVLETLHEQFEFLYHQLFEVQLKDSGKEQLYQNLFFLFNSQLAGMLLQNAAIEEMANVNEVIGSQHISPKGEMEHQSPAVKHEPGQSLFVMNAGIVLLQPFIPQLFNVLQLTDDERKVLRQPDKACAVLSILAGDAAPDETKYPLCKILCGLQPDALVHTTIEITAEERKECVHLLEHVIEYWTALKQISTNALQQTFLKRNGKISFSNDRWLLQVEQKTEDVLLQFVPWSYSVIRYPWMPQPLFTEWI